MKKFFVWLLACCLLLQPVVVRGAEDSSRQFEIDHASGTLMAYLGEETSVKVPDEIEGVPVERLGKGVFTEKPHLQELTLPEGLLSIMEGAIADCPELKKVHLPSSLLAISGFNFESCPKLQELTIPANVRAIGDEAFYFSPSLGYQDQQGDLYLPDKLKTIGAKAFYNYTGVWSVFFPASLEKIGDQAFAEDDIRYLAFAGADLPKLGKQVFEGQALTDVDIAWTASRAQEEAAEKVFAKFAPDCTVWRSNPPEEVAEYPEDDDALTRVTDGIWEMYKGEKADLTVWTSGDADEEIYALGDGLFKGNQHIRSFYPHHANWFTTIGAEAFKDSSLEYVELFDSITTIGPEAFANCKKLTSLDLPDSLTDIGAMAFAGCTGLKDLHICCDASLLPADAFQDCSALETLTLDKGQIPAGTFDGLDLKQVLLGAGVS